jgi:hypothetical protein
MNCIKYSKLSDRGLVAYGRATGHLVAGRPQPRPQKSRCRSVAAYAGPPKQQMLVRKQEIL